MQWVITTGASVAAATDAALDVLGIDAADLELEVLDQGADGRWPWQKRPVRVRARIRPTRPRPKMERRNRRRGKPERGSGAGTRGTRGPGGKKKRRGRGSGRDDADNSATNAPASQDSAGHDTSSQDEASNDSTTTKPVTPQAAQVERPKKKSNRSRSRTRTEKGTTDTEGQAPNALPPNPDTTPDPVPAVARNADVSTVVETESAAAPSVDMGVRDDSPANAETSATSPDEAPKASKPKRRRRRPDTIEFSPFDDDMPPSPAAQGEDMTDISLAEQEDTAVNFVEGILDAFDVDGDIELELSDDALEIRVIGDDLGLLIGPRGNTLGSIQELARTAVAQAHGGRLEGRIRVDIAGYRARRKEALVRFATQVSDKVKESGEAVALEPMSPPDRKIIHDAINEIDGVSTSSEGEDRRRHVVVLPD